MIKKLNTKLQIRPVNGLIYDSKNDIKLAKIAINVLHDKINELIELNNELSKKINEFNLSK